MNEIRTQFPLLHQKIKYLDNSATTQKPQQVLQAMMDFYTTTNANIHRGIYQLSEQATQQYENARQTVAKFIHAKEREIIFTSGTTESLNIVAAGLPQLAKRKKIVLTSMEHHANLVPWQQAARQYGFELQFIRLKGSILDNDDAITKIKEAGIFACIHVSNVLGTINNISALITHARNNGVITVIDAAQSIAHLPINVKQLGCDFLAFSGHKMFGPTGIGVLYGEEHMLRRLPPFKTGGDMVRSVTWDSAEWNDIPSKFEAGTPNIAGAIGLSAAVEFIQKLGIEKIQHYEHELFTYLFNKIQTVNSIELYSQSLQQSAPVLSFNLKGVHPHDVAALLDTYGICVRAGFHCAMPLVQSIAPQGTVRASLSIYNTPDEVDALVEALHKIRERFG